MVAAANRRIVATLLVVLTIWLLPLASLLDALRGSPPQPPTYTPGDESIFPHGELRIGVDASFPPFAQVTGDQLAGLEVDIGRAIGERLAVPVRFVNLGFDGLYDALRVDRVDVLISALQPDEQRLNDVLYTLSYFDAGLVLVSAANSQYSSMDTLPGASLAYEFGSVAEAVSRRWLRRIMPYETRPYELPEHALDAVRLGEADAALVDAVTARLYLSSHPNWSAQYEYVTSVRYVMAVRNDRGRVWAAVNTALESLIRDGTLAEVIERWL